MATVFSKVMAGEFPGRFVWKDDSVTAFLPLEHRALGHVIVVPRTEIDQWVDLDPDTWAHVNEVCHILGNALREEFQATRIGMLIEGYEVPHCHVHLWPSQSAQDFSDGPTLLNVAADVLDEVAQRIRTRVHHHGYDCGA